jgi:hypothetical protein
MVSQSKSPEAEIELTAEDLLLSGAMAGALPGAAGSSSSTQRARSVAPVCGAALLAALVLLGGLEIHPSGEAHDSIAGLSGPHQDVYFPSASHPAERSHAEAATAAKRPFCAVCLNRVQGLGAHLAEQAYLSAPLAEPAPPAIAAAAPLQKSLRPDGARAPPPA